MMKIVAAFGPVVAGILTGSFPALAQTAPPGAASAAEGAAGLDEVTLKSGGMIRGTIVAIEPEVEVAILVAGRELRHLPWAQLDQVTRGKYTASPASAPPASAPPAAPTPPPGPPPPPPAPTEPAPTSEGKPRIHIRTDAPGLALHEVSRHVVMDWSGGDRASGPASRLVCMAPCDQVVDAHGGRSFFFSAPGVRPSPRFQLEDRRGDVTVDVRPGSSSRYTSGSVMAALGGASLGLGALFVAMGTRGSVTATDATGAAVYTPDRAYQIGGAVGVGVGLGVLVGGVILMLRSRTTYSFVGSHDGALTLRF